MISHILGTPLMVKWREKGPNSINSGDKKGLNNYNLWLTVMRCVVSL